MLNNNHFFELDAKLKTDSVIDSELVLGEKSNHPVISILMPIYNHPDFLEIALLSAINQDFELPYEIIVVDNNHPECQKKNQFIIERMECSFLSYYVNKYNIGACGNWNRTILLSQSNYVSFCHDDDVLHPNTLKVLWDKHIEVSSDSLIIGSMNIINSAGDFVFKESDRRDKVLFLNKRDLQRIGLLDFLASNYTNGCGALYAKEKIQLLGGFKEEYSPCFDYALNTKYSYWFGSYKIKEALFDYRVSDQSDTKNCFDKIASINWLIGQNIITKYPTCLRPLLEQYNICRKNVTKYNLSCKWSGYNNKSISVFDIIVVKVYKLFLELKSYISF